MRKPVTPPRPAPQSSQRGVMLLEAMIAILIFSIGILSIVGLQASMIKNTADAKLRSEASYLAQERIGQLWTADPATLPAYLEAAPGTDISAQIPGGLRTTTSPSAGQYVITVSWLQPGPNQPRHSYTTVVTIAGN